MNYKIVDIPGNPQYNLKGIRLKNGKTCVYWTNKSAKNINEVIVLLNNKNAIGISNNQICISLHGINDINTQRECLKAFSEQLRSMGLDVKRIKFKFVIADKKDEKVVNDMISGLGINGSVLNFDVANKNVKGGSEKKEKEERIDKKIEDKFNNNREITGNSNISNIVKYNNGVRKDIVVDDNKKVAYDMSHNNLSMAEMMRTKYEELMRDPVMSEKLFSMTDEEVIKYVSNLVIMNNKEYYMDKEQNSNKDNMTNAEKATVDVASKYDGVSNTELGITSNDSRYTERKFSAVEENDNNVRVVSPDSSSIGMNNTSSNSFSSDDNYEVNNMSTNNNYEEFYNEKDEEDREEENIISYYTDTDGKVYDGRTGEVVQGYVCDENNNIVDKDGNYKGVNNGNLNDMYDNMSKNKKVDRAKTLVYKKPLVNEKEEDFYDNEYRSAAFISLPVIIFIISLILLVVSGIIWFITK